MGRAIQSARPSELNSLSHPGCFGSEIKTPNIEALTVWELRATNFYFAPNCSAARAMLLMGADNHIAGIGNMAELVTKLAPAAKDLFDKTFDDRLFERFIASLVGRPDLMQGRTSMTLHEGMTGMMDNVFINVKNKSHTITAELDIPKNGTEGVIVCQGGRFGGWSLYTKDGKLNYCYNWVGLQQYKLTTDKPLPEGKVTVKFEFAYDGGGLGKGGKGTLFVNGEKVAEGRIDHTASVIFSPDETADVGVDEASNVTDDYKERDNKFTGKIRKVVVELKK